jgi:putative endonuclease
MEEDQKEANWNQKTGKTGEDIAAAYLEREGFRILDRNWGTRMGEIDIVAMEGDTMVFCEVKARMSLEYGPPECAITAEKLKRLRRAAVAYMASHQHRAAEYRFDAVAILFDNGRPLVTHFRNILFF